MGGGGSDLIGVGGGGRRMDPDGINFRTFSRAVSLAAFRTDLRSDLGPFGVIFLSFFDIFGGQKSGVNFTQIFPNFRPAQMWQNDKNTLDSLQNQRNRECRISHDL